MVLVVGRFRVACFVYSLLCAQTRTIILFDDYANREHYHAVEEFSRPRHIRSTAEWRYLKSISPLHSRQLFPELRSIRLFPTDGKCGNGRVSFNPQAR